MTERSYILKMDQPDYDESPGFQKGPALVFLIEIMLSAAASLFSAWALFRFLYRFFFMSDISVFNEWVIRSVENKSIMMYSAAFVALIFILAVSVSVLVKYVISFWTVRAIEAPSVYNNFAASFISNLNGIIALLGPDEEVSAGLEADGPSFSGSRAMAYSAYFSITACGAALLISSIVYYSAGYHSGDLAALFLIFVFPLFTLVFSGIYRPLKACSLSLFAFTLLTLLAVFAVRHEFILRYSWFAAFTLAYLSLYAIAFAFRILKKSPSGCVLLTNRGLRILDLGGPEPLSVSGLFIPERITVCPSGYFESWTFHLPDGNAPLKITTSGAKIDEFADVMMSSAAIAPVIEKKIERAHVSDNFRLNAMKLCLPILCLAAGTIFLSRTFTVLAYLSSIPDIRSDGFLTLRSLDGEKYEKICRAILSFDPDDPFATVVLFRCLGTIDKVDERYELLKRAGEYQAKRLIPLENFITRFVDRNLKITRSAIAIIKNGPGGWEPSGPGLAEFRRGMAKAVNFEYYDKSFIDARKPAVTDFFDAMKASAASPGPRLMLAWQFYASPVPLISRMADSESAPEELFTPFEKYETTLLSKKNLPDAAEAIVLLDMFRRANARLAPAVRLENNRDFKGFSLTMDGVLPKLLRDRIVAGYLAARFDKKPLGEWEAVFKEASKFKFMDKTPVAYGRNTNLYVKPGGIYKLLFDPPQNLSEFMKVFPEISGCLSRGEAYTAIRWKTVSGYPDGHLARVFKPKYEIMDMLPEKIRDIIRNLK